MSVCAQRRGVRGALGKVVSKLYFLRRFARASRSVDNQCQDVHRKVNFAAAKAEGGAILT